MSNPTTGNWQLASTLSGSPSALTGVEPIRYNGGLFLEPAGVNEFTNPECISAANWLQSGAGAATISFVSTDGDGSSNCIEIAAAVTASGARTGYTLVPNSLSSPLGTRYWQFSAKSVAGVADWSFVVFEFNASNVLQTSAIVSVLNIPTTWTRYRIAYTPTNPNTTQLHFGLRTSVGAGTVRVDRIRLSQDQTEWFSGASGSGFAWDGTANASTSTRAASSASISPSGIFDTYLGAIVFRATPTVETGAEEIWGELGEKGAGTDHIRWGRDATKHPYVEWSGNDSAYTRITLTPTVDAGDEHFYSIEWHVGDADFRLYLDDNPSDNDTIPSPQEDYGAGTLKLEATAGGVIYNGLMICNERLTNAQRARLQDVGHWSVRTLERLRVEVARPQFELRPY